MTDRTPVIVAACRSPIGKYQGGLSTLKATELGALAIKEVLARSGLQGDAVQEVIMGNVLQAGLGQNPARAAALGAGLPDTIPAFTVNKVCGSALKAVMLAAQAIKAGDRDVVLAGGMESMSNAPHMLLGSRNGIRLGDGKLVDHMIHDGLWDHYNGFHMGETGEIVAERYEVTREDSDALAAASHEKALAAWESGAFDAESFTIEVPQRRGDPVVVSRDEGMRPGTTAEGISGMRPAFRKDGQVTAANASQLSDGAAAVIVTSKAYAEANGLEVLAEIEAYDASGTKPEWVMEAPIVSVRNLLEKTGTSIDDYALFEHNEAFASASCAVTKDLGVDMSKFNVNGGAVALGHPIGASGTRVLVTLLYALRARGGGRGIATLCLGGGNAVSMSIKA
ncbi:MAG: acetyl-CoA C-acetyltransferase [Thermoplasmatota archaeon]